jgi:hypothetical protein
VEVLTIILAITQAITAIVAVDQSRRRAKAEDAHRDAEDRLRREREARVDADQRDRDQREAFAARPVIVIEHAGASPDGSSLERRLVKVKVSNKGPTTAHRVKVGIRLAGEEYIAGPGGTPGEIQALAPTDELRILMVQLDSELWRSMPLYQVDNPPLWARWFDALGNEYSDEVPAP